MGASTSGRSSPGRRPTHVFAQHAGGADYPLEPVAISHRLVPDSRDVRGFVGKRTHRTRQSIGPFVAPNACMRLRQRCQLRADRRNKNQSGLD
jgi:hypothetical protein